MPSTVLEGGPLQAEAFARLHGLWDRHRRSPSELIGAGVWRPTSPFPSEGPYDGYVGRKGSGPLPPAQSLVTTAFSSVTESDASATANVVTDVRVEFIEPDRTRLSPFVEAMLNGDAVPQELALYTSTSPDGGADHVFNVVARQTYGGDVRRGPTGSRLYVYVPATSPPSRIRSAAAPWSTAGLGQLVEAVSEAAAEATSFSAPTGPEEHFRIDCGFEVPSGAGRAVGRLLRGGGGGREWAVDALSVGSDRTPWLDTYTAAAAASETFPLGAWDLTLSVRLEHDVRDLSALCGKLAWFDVAVMTVRPPSRDWGVLRARSDSTAPPEALACVDLVVLHEDRGGLDPRTRDFFHGALAEVSASR